MRVLSTLTWVRSDIRSLLKDFAGPQRAAMVWGARAGRQPARERLRPARRSGSKEFAMADEREERGQPAGFDPKTGEVHGAGSGAGGNNPAEDYDEDPIS